MLLIYDVLGNPLPADVRPFAAKNPDLTTRVCALIEFERTEFAIKARKTLSRDGENQLKVLFDCRKNAKSSVIHGQFVKLENDLNGFFSGSRTNSSADGQGQQEDRNPEEDPDGQPETTTASATATPQRQRRHQHQQWQCVCGQRAQEKNRSLRKSEIFADCRGAKHSRRSLESEQRYFRSTAAAEELEVFSIARIWIQFSRVFHLGLDEQKNFQRTT